MLTLFAESVLGDFVVIMFIFAIFYLIIAKDEKDRSENNN